jgi:lipopolysaccharide/colanic/teichoic acid biosynthesis glycosyltransferase/GGDEF domain-containing protein
MFGWNNSDSTKNIENGFCCPDTFKKRLAEERRRSERTGKPFSVMSMDVEQLKEKYTTRNDCDLKLFRKKITEIVKKNCRTIDIKTWGNGNELKIMLPETSENEANIFKEKMLSRYDEGAKENKHKIELFDMRRIIDITTYPEFVFGNERSGETVRNKKNGTKGHVRQLFFRKGTAEGRPPASGMSGAGARAWALYADLKNEGVYYDYSGLVKRVVDVIGAIVGILLFMPAILIFAIAIKMTSRGPVFFKQERIGFMGQKFMLFKFRTMYHGCDDETHKTYVKNLIKNQMEKCEKEESEKKVYKIENDDRITSVGRFLRKSSMDELPQFYNVLRGDMSLVGPRPPIAYEVGEYQTWHLRRVLEAKPGITGLWQVKGRSRTSFDEMVRMDILYVNNRSLWLDIKILIQTCLVVMNGKGAY